MFFVDKLGNAEKQKDQVWVSSGGRKSAQGLGNAWAACGFLLPTPNFNVKKNGCHMTGCRASGLCMCEIRYALCKSVTPR